MSAQHGIMLAPSPSLPVPVIGRAAHSLAWLKGLEPPYRQSGFVTIMAKRVGLDGPILKKIAVDRPAQFVTLRWQARCGSMAAVDSTFKNDDIDALGCQLARS